MQLLDTLKQLSLSQRIRCISLLMELKKFYMCLRNWTFFNTSLIVHGGVPKAEMGSKSPQDAGAIFYLFLYPNFLLYPGWSMMSRTNAIISIVVSSFVRVSPWLASYLKAPLNCLSQIGIGIVYPSYPFHSDSDLIAFLKIFQNDFQGIVVHLPWQPLLELGDCHNALIKRFQGILDHQDSIQGRWML